MTYQLPNLSLIPSEGLLRPAWGLAIPYDNPSVRQLPAPTQQKNARRPTFLGDNILYLLMNILWVTKF